MDARRDLVGVVGNMVEFQVRLAHVVQLPAVIGHQSARLWQRIVVEPPSAVRYQCERARLGMHTGLVT